MNIVPIKTDKQYNIALKRIEKLWGSVPNTQPGNELDILLALVEYYETYKIDPIRSPDPLSGLNFFMEQKGFSQKDLASILGSTRASEILTGKKDINLKQILMLNISWKIPYSLLIENHPLKNDLIKKKIVSRKPTRKTVNKLKGNTLVVKKTVKKNASKANARKKTKRKLAN